MKLTAEINAPAAGHEASDPADQDLAADSARAAGPLPFTRRDLLILLGLTLIAAFLRLHRLGEWSFWVDEAHTFRDATKDIDGFWASHVARYPLSYLMLRGLLGVLPSVSEGWLRLPFVFFGIAAIPGLAIVGRSLVGRRAALVAAALLAVSPWHIYWSQNCRSYAIVSFLSVLAMGAYYHAHRHRVLTMGLVSIGLVVVAGLCHPSAYPLFAAVLVFAGLARLLSTGSERADAARSRLERWLPWLVLGVFVALFPLIAGGLSYFARAKPDFSLLHLVQTTTFFVRIPLILAAVGGFLWLLQRRERTALFLMCWAIVPLLVLAAGLFKVTAQYAFYTLPAYCLLAGCAMRAYVPARHDRDPAARAWLSLVLRAVPLSILLADSLAGTFLYYTKQHGDRPNWRAARDFIERDVGSQKLVLTTNAPSMCYYLDPEHMQPDESAWVVQIVGWDMSTASADNPGSSDPEPPRHNARLTAATPEQYLDMFVDEARARQARLYVVVTEPELAEMDPSGRFNRRLRSRLHQVLRLPVWTGPKDMEVLVYELPTER